MFSDRPSTFNAQPNIPVSSNNICAQAAVASVLEFWGRVGGYASRQHLINALCTQWAPDNFGGALGTSSSQIIKMIDAHGLTAKPVNLEPWLPGGFINPANQILWNPHRQRVEEHVKSGNPAICLVKSSKVGSTQWGLHWCVLAEIIGSQVRVCNAFNAVDQYVDRTMSLKEFHEAWECDGLEGLIPGIRFHAVLIAA